MQNQKNLNFLFSIEEPVKRRAMLASIVSKEIEDRGFDRPIIVGGEALEIYSSGHFTTGDIDIKAPLNALEEILIEMNFVKKQGFFYHPELEVGFDWLGANMDEGEEAEKRTVDILIQKGLKLRLVSPEDLIIDRLNASKWWKDTDSYVQAEFLLQIKSPPDLDLDYLKKRANEEDLEDILEKLLNEYK